jgi:acetamidase/formamidase
MLMAQCSPAVMGMVPKVTVKSVSRQSKPRSRGTFRLTVRDDLQLSYPRAETPAHVITMGMHEDLDRCAEMALRDMIAWIVVRTGLSREDAYMLCSLAGDLRITQTVNGNKGVHMMMAKTLLEVQSG